VSGLSGEDHPPPPQGGGNEMDQSPIKGEETRKKLKLTARGRSGLPSPLGGRGLG